MWDITAVDMILLFEQYCVNDGKAGSGYSQKINLLPLQEIKFMFDKTWSKYSSWIVFLI